MDGHCLETVSNGLFLMDKTLEAYVYEFGTNEWETISSQFPCDNLKQTKVVCKSFDDDLVIVPSIKNGSSCTGIFDLKSKSWMEMDKDKRNAPYNGFLDRLPNDENEEILLFFGGYQFQNDTIRDEIIWKFNGQDMNWEEFSIKLPNNLRENTTTLTLVHHNTCS